MGNADRLIAYQSLIEEYRDLKKRLVGGKIQRFRDSLEDYENSLPGWLETKKRYASDFNPFQVLDLTKIEKTHSDVLAWLLDPRETHSQGDLFFKGLIESLDLGFQYDPWRYKVKREYTGDESRIDIIIYGRDFVIYIENKTLAREGPEQTHREYRDLIRLLKRKGLPETNVAAIFLSRKGEEPKAEGWIPMSYRSLAETINETVENDEDIPEYLRSFITSWTKELKQLGG